MADAKITELTALTAVSTADLIAVVDDVAGTPITKKATVANLFAQQDGWQTDASWSSPSFADTNGESTLTVTVPTDATTKYQAGMRVKFTQNATVRYGIITKVAATELTIFVNTDYTPTGDAITLPFYSMMKTPFGFDLDVSNYQVVFTDSTNREKAGPTIDTWYNLSNIAKITVPIGSWLLEYDTDIDCFTVKGAGERSLFMSCTLSTANNSESDEDFTFTFGIKSYASAINSTNRTHAHRAKTVNLTIKDVYYLNMASKGSDISYLRNLNSAYERLVIKATCAYL